MGLDITLVKIVDKEVNEYCWLIVSESPELLPLFSHLIRVKHFSYPDEEYDEEVFYYETISYQRKGVNGSFYQDFENDKCLVDKAEVEKMWQYVVEERKQNFKIEFVDRFINGETIVIVSW